MTIRKQEISGLTLQQALSIQEQLNSEMAIADSKLRNKMARNDEQFRNDYPEAAGTEYEDQAKMTWYVHHPYAESDERSLWEDKKYLEETAAILSDHIETMELNTYIINNV